MAWFKRKPDPISDRARALNEEIARLEKRPFLLHYDGHHNRIDRIVRPGEAQILEREVFSEALAVRSQAWL